MKAVFLDRDGTINRDRGFTHRVEDLEFLPGSIQGLKKLYQSGYSLFITTNQSGLARGIFTESQMHEFHKAMIGMLNQEGVQIKEIYFDNSHPDKPSAWRKPRTGMIDQAVKDFAVQLPESFVIGDRISDIELGLNANLKPILVLTGQVFEDLWTLKNHPPEFVAKDLLHASQFICESDFSKLVDNAQLAEHCKSVRRSGKRLVSLNGSFDIMHEGHLKILTEAKSHGDHLIVALNSDDSIKSYKSPNRPINQLKSRMLMMSSYSCVDTVTFFDEENPIEVLKQIKPDIHINGSDYGKDCIEAETVKENGGRVELVELMPGLSTTTLLQNKFKNL